MPEPLDEASEVTSVDGAVIVDGPDGVAVTMTPAAALKTAGRLDQAALDALIAGQGVDPPGDEADPRAA